MVKKLFQFFLRQISQNNHKSDYNYESCWTKSMWDDPNRRYFPIIRWWWPGNAVNIDQLGKELNIFKVAGFSE